MNDAFPADLSERAGWGFGQIHILLRLAANRMVDINILFIKKDGKEKEYRFVNPFFRAWLLKNG